MPLKLKISIYVKLLPLIYLKWQSDFMQAIQISAGKQGRIVIPAALRQQLGIESGTQVIVWIENNQLILKPKEQLWAAIHQEAEKIPKEVDLAEELIQERRQAAKLENKG